MSKREWRFYVNDDGDVHVRVNNLTFIVFSYKGPTLRR